MCAYSAQHALKVDVTSLVNKAAPPGPVVVVASDVTRSRDVVKMVLQKLGMDRQKVSVTRLVAVINNNLNPDHGKHRAAFVAIAVLVWIRLT